MAAVKNKPLIIIATVLLVIALIFPLYSGIIGSITPYEGIGKPSLIPRYFHWQNYLEIWGHVPLAMYMLNSLLYAGLACLLAVGAAFPASYALSRFQFTGKYVIMFFVLVTQMVSVSMIIIPMFRTIIALNMFDSRLAVIITISAMPVPMITWLLKNYLDTIPVELEEAAAVDGCNRIGALLRILLPVAVPGVVTSIIIAFTTTYNQFFIPMVFLSSFNKFPALVGVYTMSSELVPPWHLVMAACLVVLLIPLIVFFFCQRYVMSGLTAGSVKG